jgi:hypothetical protein
MAQIILDSNNNLIQGDFDNATLNNRTKLQTTTTNATTNVYVVPNGSSTSAGVSVANNSSLTNASKIVMATNGTTDTQIISGINGSGTYLPLSFYTNNTLAMQVDTSQRVAINGASAVTGIPLNIGSTTGSVGIALQPTNGIGVYAYWTTDATNGYLSSSSGTTGKKITYALAAPDNALSIDGDGYLIVPKAYSATTGSAANLHVLSSGVFVRSTSSIKYKTDVQDAVHGLDKVMELRPVTYKGINDGDIVFGGLIAEEVHEAGLTEFVQYAEDGTPDALAYGNMVSLLTKAIQEQQTIINELKSRIEALESK